MPNHIVRPLERRDLQARVDWYNSTDIFRTMTMDPPISEAGTKHWYNNTITDDSRRDFCLVDEDDLPLSMFGLTDIDQKHNHAELYIFVSPDYQRKGIGKKSTQWLCNYGFNTFDLEKIYLYYLEGNTSAKKLYKHIGFTHEGKLRNHIFKSGQYIDRNIMSLLREEWTSLNWQTSSIRFSLSL